MSTPFSDKELINRIRWYTNVRWFFVLAIGLPGTISLIINSGISHPQVLFNAGVMLALLAANLLILISTQLPVRLKGFYGPLSAVQVTLDIVAMTAVFHFNGGFETPIVMLYCIPILMSGVLLSKQAVYVTGFAVTLIFAVLGWLDFSNVFKPDNIVAPEIHSSPQVFWPVYVTTIMILLVITFITNLVAHFVRQSSRLEGELAGVKTERAKTEAIIQSMGSSLVAINNKGKIILVNPAFEKLTGWQAHDVIGREAETILHVVSDDGKPQPDITQALQVVFDHKKSVTQRHPYFVGDNLLKRKNGSTFSYTGHLSAIIVDGHVEGATFVFEDASALREVGKLKSNFIALASHQLKTPIGEIKNYSEAMLGGVTGKLNKKQKTYIEHMRDIATRCNQMVTYLLDMSLLERGELRAKLQPVLVYALLETIAELYKGRARTKGLTIKVTGDRNLVVQGDEMMLQEVVGSLLANGISYTNDGVIELCATTVGGVGCIEVTDQGEGIDKAKLQQLFRKESVLAGLPEAGSGTGLGLYLAHEFVRLQGGVIMADHNDEKGTIFRIELPIITNEREKS